MARIDKYIWAVRLYKTRSVAAEACKKGRVHINTQEAKPSREVKIGDTIHIKRNPMTLSFKVLALTQNRVGPKLVSTLIEDVTTPDQKELMEIDRINRQNQRAKGLGRPTKKDRRDIEDFFIEDEDEFDFEEI